MARVKLATALLAAAVCLGACDNRPATWKGFVYPDGADLGSHVELGSFDTFEQCQASARDVIKGFGRSEEGEQGQSAADYECGFKCAAHASIGGLNVCKETRK